MSAATIGPARTRVDGRLKVTGGSHFTGNIISGAQFDLGAADLSAGSYADGLHQPMGQILAYRRITGGERIDGFSQEVVLAIGAVQVMHVAPMLAVNPPGHSGACRHRQEFQGWKISRVDNRRAQLAQQAPEP